VRAVRDGPPEPDDKILTPAEVAPLFGVDPKTVGRWVKLGKLDHFRTPGGHIRIRQSAVNKWLAANSSDSDARPEGADPA